MNQTKGEALLEAVRITPVGNNVIIHNSNKQIWCILKVIAKEHDEDITDDGGFVWPKIKEEEMGQLSDAIKELLKDASKEVAHYLNIAYLLAKQEEESPK